MPLFAKIKGSTLVKKKKYVRGYTLKQSLKASKGQGFDITRIIHPPEGEDFNEWLAMLSKNRKHVLITAVEHFNAANSCAGLIKNRCTPQTCPNMAAGPNYTYLWQDSKSELYSKSTAVPAAKLLMDSISAMMDDESIFPSTENGHFPKRFREHMQTIWKRLFRIYFHIYYHHWDDLKGTNEEAEVNSSFKWLFYASKELQMVQDKDLQPVKELISKIPDMPHYTSTEASQETSRGSLQVTEIEGERK